MNDDKLKAIIEEAIKPIKDQLNDPSTGLGAINNQLNDPDIGLEAIKSQLNAASAGVATIEQKINAYGDMYKINDSNIRKMEKRLETIEENSGVDVLPELKLGPLSEVA